LQYDKIFNSREGILIDEKSLRIYHFIKFFIYWH